MKILQGSAFILFVLLLFVKCTDDKIGSRDWPRLDTKPVTNITTLGAQFNADIIWRGNFEIRHFGFVWSSDFSPTVEASDRVVLSGNLAGNSFSAKIETNLDDDVNINVRSFVETADYIVYGKEVEFHSMGSGAPTITAFKPLSGSVGDTVSIIGHGFSYLPINDKIEFANLNGPIYGGTNKADVISATDTLLLVKVPLIVYETYVKVNVTIYHWTATSNESFRYGSPKN